MIDSYVTYFRVSTAGQGRSGLGLKAQQAAVSRFLVNKTGEVVESFKEIGPGKNNDRPELERALRRCRLTGAVLVVAKLDRLQRRPEAWSWEILCWIGTGILTLLVPLLSE